MASVVVNGDVSGSVTLQAPSAAGSVTVTLPSTSGVMAVTGGSPSFTDITATGNLTVNGNTTLGDASTDTVLITGAPSIGGAGLGMGMGFRNRIINGAMVIDQRNAGASINIGVSGATSQYTLDRWVFEVSQAPKISAQQSTNAPAGFSNSLLVTSLAATTVGAADYFQVNQKIEGFNTADFGFGAAGASTTTLSFWVKSTLTGSFSGTLKNSAQTRSYPFSYTINSANTWEQKTVTVPGDTSGTWVGGANGIGLNVNFSLGMGSSYTSTANSWQASNLGGVNSSVNLVSTNAATWQITGVQLEKGATATSFDYRPYGTELALCQRYYWRWTANYSSHPIAVFQAYSSTAAWGKLFDLPVTMRTTPTASTSGNFGATNAAASAITNFTTTNIVQNTANMLATGAWTGSSGLVAGNATVVVAAAAGNYIDASAEL